MNIPVGARVEAAEISPCPRLKMSGEPSRSSWKKCAPPSGQLLTATRILHPHESSGTQDNGGLLGSEAAEHAAMVADAKRRARRSMIRPVVLPLELIKPAKRIHLNETGSHHRRHQAMRSASPSQYRWIASHASSLMERSTFPAASVQPGSCSSMGAQKEGLVLSFAGSVQIASCAAGSTRNLKVSGAAALERRTTKVT